MILILDLCQPYRPGPIAQIHTSSQGGLDPGDLPWFRLMWPCKFGVPMAAEAFTDAGVCALRGILEGFIEAVCCFFGEGVRPSCRRVGLTGADVDLPPVSRTDWEESAICASCKEVFRLEPIRRALVSASTSASSMAKCQCWALFARGMKLEADAELARR